MKIELEIEYTREEMEELLIAAAQEKYPAPAGYQYRVKHIFMDRGTVELEEIEVAEPKMEPEPELMKLRAMAETLPR